MPRTVLFLVAQLALGLAILLAFNWFVVGLAVASLALVFTYPFMKRVTWWPQAFLGFTFNWGALLGWAAVHGGLDPAPLVLYAGGIAWTLGYDTIYAHQDRVDDLQIGVKSSALKLGARTKPFLWSVYTAAILLFCLAGGAIGLGIYFYVAMLIAWSHFAWQIFVLDINEPQICLKVFRSNIGFGAIVFLAIVAGQTL